MATVELVAESDATGTVREIYEDIRGTRAVRTAWRACRAGAISERLPDESAASDHRPVLVDTTCQAP